MSECDKNVSILFSEEGNRKDKDIPDLHDGNNNFSSSSLGAGEVQKMHDVSKEVIASEEIKADTARKKAFYLELAQQMCPTATPDKSENMRLSILYSTIQRMAKLLTLFENYPWEIAISGIQKGCGLWLMAAGESKKERLELNDFLAVRSVFISKVLKNYALLCHCSLHFIQQKKDLEELLNINSSRKGNIKK